MRDFSAVTVRLVYLARLREAFDAGGESLTLPAASTTVSGVLDRLRERGGSYATELAPGRPFRVAVNHALVGADHPVQDGDELALFPPVTGG